MKKIIDIKELCFIWNEAKEAEKESTELRRRIEDRLASLLGVPENLDGTENFDLEAGYKIKITGRITRKVDSDKLQELAAEHGLTEHLHSLFRWTPEINATAWKQSDDSITKPLLDAITSKAGRPSFTITKEI